MKPFAPIFISIDDNEIANLKLLCNEIFGEQNFVACLPTIMNLKGNQDQFGFAGTHEYTLVYCKDKNLTEILEFDIKDEDLQEWEIDDIGYFKKGANLKSTGVNAPRGKRPFLFYPILINNETLEITSVTTDEYKLIYTKETKTFNDSYVSDLQKIYEQKGYTFILPITNNENMSWRWQREKILNEPYNIIVSSDNGNFSIYKKQRPSIGDMPTKKPKTLFYKPEYSSGNGTAQLKQIFGRKVFNNPKPINLIKDFLKIGGNKDALILDFFAGSGTTLHATLELNKDDNGKRKSVLVTNNENNICEEITYVRCKRLINGYKNENDDQVIEPYNDNFKYYQTDFVPAKSTDLNKEKLTKQSVEMLCLRENTFEPVMKDGPIKIFKNKEKYTAILLDQLAIPKIKEIIKEYDKPVNVYIFSLGDDNFADEFQDMKNKVTVKSIPAAILRVYRRIFK
jgi:adenine-specific DNA-methyltransferase